MLTCLRLRRKLASADWKKNLLLKEEIIMNRYKGENV